MTETLQAETTGEAVLMPVTGARAAAAVPEWVMLARVGTWLGHPTVPEIIDADHLRSALDYFDRHYAAHEADLVIDYHHASVLAPAGGAKAPAAGWIQRMRLRADGTELWGRVRWTDDAAEAIRARRFRYLSPVFRFGAPDRVTGEPVPMFIHSVALTNTPFLTELQGLNEQRFTISGRSKQAVATEGDGANPTPAEGGETMSLLDRIAEVLDREPGEVASALGLTGTEDEEVAEAVMANAAEPEHAAPPVSPAVANALGVAADADETAVKAAIIGLKAPGAGLEAVRRALGLDEAAPQADVLNAIGELQQQRRHAEAEEVVDAAVEAGKIPPAHREFYLREALNDLDAARAVINSLPALMDSPAPPTDTGERALTEAEKGVCRQLGISAEAYLNAAGASA
ncbi:MAG: phage protease [Planctomycetota bacterium]